MKGVTHEEVETLNTYNHPVTETEIERPNNLYTEQQFKEAVEQIVPDDVDVTVSDRMTRTVTEATFENRTDKVVAVKASYRIFREEEHRFTAGNGWEVVVSSLKDIGVLDD